MTSSKTLITRTRNAAKGTEKWSWWNRHDSKSLAIVQIRLLNFAASPSFAWRMSTSLTTHASAELSTASFKVKLPAEKRKSARKKTTSSSQKPPPTPMNFKKSWRTTKTMRRTASETSSFSWTNSNYRSTLSNGTNLSKTTSYSTEMSCPRKHPLM